MLLGRFHCCKFADTSHCASLFFPLLSHSAATATSLRNCATAFSAPWRWHDFERPHLFRTRSLLMTVCDIACVRDKINGPILALGTVTRNQETAFRSFGPFIVIAMQIHTIVAQHGSLTLKLFKSGIFTLRSTM